MKNSKINLPEVSRSALYDLQDELNCGRGIAQFLFQRIRDCASHPCELAVITEHLQGSKRTAFLNQVQVEVTNLCGKPKGV